MRKPSLEYHWVRQSGDDIVVDEGPLLATVNTVTCWDRNGSVEVWAQGRVLKKDGEAGRVQRSASVNVHVKQPRWLQEIIDDARRRLA